MFKLYHFFENKLEIGKIQNVQNMTFFTKNWKKSIKMIIKKQKLDIFYIFGEKIKS